MNNNFVKKLAIAATVFGFVVVLLGAFTRLSDAGLGCPDWPGCYDFLHIPTKAEDIDKANQAYPERPYEFAKAWPEMVHRYFAGILGLMVLALALLSLKNKHGYAKKHSFGLLALIIFQAALGMWTVTMKLHPGIVMAHLAGGFAMLVLLAALSLRYVMQFKSSIGLEQQLKYRGFTIFATIVLIIQILLGGWTSANYAATVCYELPICQAGWYANSDFVSAFQIWGHGADDYEFGILENDARIAIHASHRIGAIIATIILAFLSYRLISQNSCQKLKKFGLLIGGLLIVQVVLGIFNIIFQLPLYNAVAHNGVGALLLVAMGLLIAKLYLPTNVQPQEAVGNSND